MGQKPGLFVYSAHCAGRKVIVVSSLCRIIILKNVVTLCSGLLCTDAPDNDMLMEDLKIFITGLGCSSAYVYRSKGGDTPALTPPLPRFLVIVIGFSDSVSLAHPATRFKISGCWPRNSG